MTTTRTDDQILDAARHADLTVDDIAASEGDDDTLAAEVWTRFPELARIIWTRKLRRDQLYSGVSPFDDLETHPDERFPELARLTAAAQAWWTWLRDGDDSLLRERPAMTGDEAAEHCGVVRSTWDAYVTRGHAPKPIGHAFLSGTRTWDADVVAGWHASRQHAQEHTPARTCHVDDLDIDWRPARADQARAALDAVAAGWVEHGMPEPVVGEDGIIHRDAVPEIAARLEAMIGAPIVGR